MRVTQARAYLVMELVDGPSALNMLRNGGPLPLPQALWIAEQVAMALAAAHTIGIVHRDVKPANVLVSPEVHAKLTDFGIAKDVNSVGSLTASGTGLGTLAYVSPEQAVQASGVDHRADVYSLGATLYHLIGGQPPFGSRVTGKIVREILEQPPRPLSSLRADCPGDVVDLVHQMLEKAPEARPASAEEVRASLHELIARFWPNYRPREAPPWSLSDSVVEE